MQTIYFQYQGILIAILIYSDSDFDSDLIVINKGWNSIYGIHTFICLGKRNVEALLKSITTIVSIQ